MWSSDQNDGTEPSSNKSYTHFSVLSLSETSFTLPTNRAFYENIRKILCLTSNK